MAIKYLEEMSWLQGRWDRDRAVTRGNPRAAGVKAAGLLGSLSDVLCCLGDAVWGGAELDATAVSISPQAPA